MHLINLGQGFLRLERLPKCPPLKKYHDDSVYSIRNNPLDNLSFHESNYRNVHWNGSQFSRTKIIQMCNHLDNFSLWKLKRHSEERRVIAKALIYLQGHQEISTCEHVNNLSNPKNTYVELIKHTMWLGRLSLQAMWWALYPPLSSHTRVTQSQPHLWPGNMDCLEPAENSKTPHFRGERFSARELKN